MHGNLHAYSYWFSYDHGDLSTEQRRLIQHSRHLRHDRKPARITHHNHSRRMHTIHHGSTGSKLRMHRHRDRPVHKSNHPNRHSNLHRRSDMQSRRECGYSNLHRNANRPGNRTLIHNRRLRWRHRPCILQWNHERNNSRSPNHHHPHVPARISRHWNSHSMHRNSNRFFRNRHSHYPNRINRLHNQCNRHIRNLTLHISRRHNCWNCKLSGKLHAKWNNWQNRCCNRNLCDGYQSHREQ